MTPTAYLVVAFVLGANALLSVWGVVFLLALGKL